MPVSGITGRAAEREAGLYAAVDAYVRMHIPMGIPLVAVPQECLA